jgi:hypothetical protein
MAKARKGGDGVADHGVSAYAPLGCRLALHPLRGVEAHRLDASTPRRLDAEQHRAIEVRIGDCLSAEAVSQRHASRSDGVTAGDQREDEQPDRDRCDRQADADQASLSP